MPSFRAQLNITGLRPGTAPEQVMETAVETLASMHHLEANQLDIVAGVPRITLRFTVLESEYDGENRQAADAAAAVRHAVEGVAHTARPRLLRLVRGKWLPLG